MMSHTDKDDDYGDIMLLSDHSEPDPVAPESSQVQVVVDIHEQPKFTDEEESSVEVVQGDGVAQVVGVDEYGVEWWQTADIERPVFVPKPKHPETRVKQVHVAEMSPEDKTTYSMGDSPIKPQVLRPRSPVRARVFPPRLEARFFRGYYPDSPEIQCSPIRQRSDTRPEPFPTQRRGMPEYG